MRAPMSRSRARLDRLGGLAVADGLRVGLVPVLWLRRNVAVSGTWSERELGLGPDWGMSSGCCCEFAGALELAGKLQQDCFLGGHELHPDR